MNRILKKIYTVFALIGTAGASDASNITLLQSIIQSTLSLVAFGVFTKLAGGFNYNGDTGELEVDQLELFRQINHHTPIDGYRVFAKIQNGNRYTVTFSSKDNMRCVLAEVQDFTDPQGKIEIIVF